MTPSFVTLLSPSTSQVKPAKNALLSRSTKRRLPCREYPAADAQLALPHIERGVLQREAAWRQQEGICGKGILPARQRQIGFRDKKGAVFQADGTHILRFGRPHQRAAGDRERAAAEIQFAFEHSPAAGNGETAAFKCERARHMELPIRKFQISGHL